MRRVYNFCAVTSMLPESVLKKAAGEMLEYESTGQSVMEMSHRSKAYEAIINGCEALLREVMAIPDNYKVLFLQGGASSQFAMIPLNLMNKSGKADYVITGQKNHIRKAPDTENAKRLLLLQTRPLHIFQNSTAAHLQRMLIISTFAKIIRSTVHVM